MKETIDFRTPLQRERDKRDEIICARYNEIKCQAPKDSQWAIWRVLSEEFGMKPQGIRYAIERKTRKCNLEESKREESEKIVVTRLN
jgi:hypothetical protein